MQPEYVEVSIRLRCSDKLSMNYKKDNCRNNINHRLAIYNRYTYLRWSADVYYFAIDKLTTTAGIYWLIVIWLCLKILTSFIQRQNDTLSTRQNFLTHLPAASSTTVATVPEFEVAWRTTTTQSEHD